MEREDLGITAHVGGFLRSQLLSIPPRTDLCTTGALALATMSESNPKDARIDNVYALQKRDMTEDGGEQEDEVGPHPKRWAGIVKENHGLIVLRGWNSGEWKVEIDSRSLEKNVFARVNEDRKPGEQVQFNLDPRDQTGETAGGTWFEHVRDHSDPSKELEELEWEENKGWRPDMFLDEEAANRSSGDESSS